MATIRDTDLFYVQRGDDPYKWTGAELKDLVSSVAGEGKLTLGAYLTPAGASYDGTKNITVNVNATSSNSASKVVARDGAGNFSANKITVNSLNSNGTITAPTFKGYLDGNAKTASNADKLDNVNSTQFLRSDTSDKYQGGKLEIQSDSVNGHYWGAGLEYARSRWEHTNKDSYGFLIRNWNGLELCSAQEAGTSSGSVARLNTLKLWTDGSLTFNTHKVWHAGNDGAGSGLDADKLDGLTSGSFLRSDANDSASGELTFNGKVNVRVGLDFADSDYIHMGSSDDWQVYRNANNWTYITDKGHGIIFTDNGTPVMRLEDSGVFRPENTNTGAIGTSSKRWANIYATTFHGAVSGKASDADKLDGIDSSQFLRSDVSDTANGRIQFRSGNAQSGGTTAGSQGALEIYQATKNKDAFMAFHVGGDYAAYFGLDGATNDLFYGGWSRGSTKYRVWHAGNDGSGSGLDADKLDGFQSSQSATGNTVAVRNSSGDTYSRLFRSTYQNQSSISGAMAFRVNTSDNYIRFCSDTAAIRNFLSVPTGGGSGASGTWNINISGTAANADKLDGINSTQFLRSDQDDTTSGNLTISKAHARLVLDSPGSGSAWPNQGCQISLGESGAGGSASLHLTYSGDGYSYVGMGTLGTGSPAPSKVAMRMYYQNNQVYFYSNPNIAGYTNWHSGNDGSGSGLDADKLRGLVPATGATKNTIAQRDGSGHLTGNYLFGAYVNMSHVATTRSSDTIFYSSTDNYIRKNNSTGMRNALNVPTRTGGGASGTWSISITGSAGSSSNATNTTNVRVDHDTGNTWHRPVFISDGQKSGTNQRLYTDNASTIGINPNSNQIRATTFVGNLSGKSTSADNATNVRVDHDAGNAWHRPIFITDGQGSTSNQRLYSDSASTIGINPSSNQIRATKFIGDLDGKATSAGYADNSDMLDGVHRHQFLRSDTPDEKTSGRLRFNDNVMITFGNSDDAEFFHNNNHLYTDLNKGNWYIRDGTTTRFTFDDAGHFTATGNITANGNVNSKSDVRVKENVETLEGSLDKVKQLRGVEYDRIDSDEKYHQFGVIAQEVEKIYPDMVSEDEDGMKTMSYTQLIPVLIEAIKEQQQQIDDLKGFINK